MIIPSIDIMDGKAVQLIQGKKKVIERSDIDQLVEEFSLFGDIAVIDLDAALGKGSNNSLIKKICKMASCRVGGGIRTKELADEYLQAGAKKIIIGRKATPDFLKQLPKNKVVVAIDTKGGLVVTKGWTNATGKSPLVAIKELEQYCSGFLFTNVDKEGLMQGTDQEIVDELVQATRSPLTIAGGISSLEEVKTLVKKGVFVQLGMALYTNTFSMTDAFLGILDFEKNQGTIPTIVQDTSGQVLMLAFSTKESLENAVAKRKGVYYSRSRKEIWEKGKTSGSAQDLVKIAYDCDQDTLLFTVKQKGAACHTGSYSCFGERDFTLQSLYALLKERKEVMPEGSYTSKLLTDPDLLMEKIQEESNEVINYRDRENLVWEIADLSYFLLVLMARERIAPEEIKNELSRRQK